MRLPREVGSIGRARPQRPAFSSSLASAPPMSVPCTRLRPGTAASQRTLSRAWRAAARTAPALRRFGEARGTHQRSGILSMPRSPPKQRCRRPPNERPLHAVARARAPRTLSKLYAISSMRCRPSGIHTGKALDLALCILRYYTVIEIRICAHIS